jgi:hypothetical protein
MRAGAIFVPSKILGPVKFSKPVTAITAFSLRLKHDARMRFRQEGMQMRPVIGIAAVVAIGLFWSVAAMSKWVPVASADMRSATVIGSR